MLTGPTSFAAVIVATILAAILYFLWGRHLRKREKEALLTLADMAALGEVVPDTMYPVINLDVCIGSGACVRACPEKNVLEIVHGQAKLLNALACVGHSACVQSCPVDAIKLVLGSATRGVELPKVDANFQTTRAGVYIIGELGGMGLIRNAVRQGRQAADHIVSGSRRGSSADSRSSSNSSSSSSSDVYDVAVVGAGPAGISATLRLMEAGIRVTLLEREAFGGTIMHYPRAKVVMTGALEFAIIGKVSRRRMSKEQLVELWQSIQSTANLPIRTGVLVEGVTAEDSGIWRLETSVGSIRAANVMLGLGRRGSPRKLDVAGEDQPKVHYRLLEPTEFTGKHVLVVGGGNSAVESALSLADSGVCASVTISYRRNAFARCQAENRRRVDELIRTGKIRPLMPSVVKCINQTDVLLGVDNDMEMTIQNDAVIVQAGGTAPSELLKKFGIDVITKHGEA